MHSNIKKSNEQFITESVALHGEAYEYDRLECVNSKTAVTLFCKKHKSYFAVIPSGHLNKTKKSGCQKCSLVKRADWCRGSLEEFVSRSKAVQGSLGRSFDYSKVVYQTARVKVDIGCNTCGTWFMQSPYAHMEGHGCANCRDNTLAKERSHTKEQFVAAAMKVDLGRYNYDLVVYKNARNYVDIKCNDCGNIFKKKPTEILNGHGCRCHTEPFGYRPEEEGKLYILTCGNLTKVGITNGEPSNRAKVVSKAYGDEFSVVAYFPMDGKVCTDLETRLLDELRARYKSPQHKFDGYTECFYDVDRKFIYQRVDSLMRDMHV